MSLLMWSQSPTSVIVLSDTLAISPIDGEPAFFVDKTFAFRRLNAVVAGTGNGLLLTRWVELLRSGTLALNFDEVSTLAPGALRKVSARLAGEFQDVEMGTSTIYQFGWSDRHGCYVRQTFRSTSQFEAEEEVTGSLMVKPAPENFEPEPMPEDDFIGGMVRLAHRVKDEDDARIFPARVGIGGQLVLTILEGGRVSSKVIHVFADFEAQWNSACAALRRQDTSQG